MQPEIEPCCSDHMRVPVLRPLPLPTPDEAEREARRREQGALDGVIDAHVHLFPDAIFAALHRWFDDNAWRIAFRGTAAETIAHLRARGVDRMVALVFGHKPGVARSLNRYLAELARAEPSIIGVGTVLPGEPDARQIVREAIEIHRLHGIKLHCHVQRVAIDDPRSLDVLRACQELDVPAVVHAGREPASSAYGVDTHAMCNVARTRRVLQQLPDLQLVIPHIGADEYNDYLQLCDEFPNLWLDTAMACADYFEDGLDWQQLEAHAPRILYGTDFPIVPYEMGRERTVLARRIIDDVAFARIMGGNAAKLWGI